MMKRSGLLLLAVALLSVSCSGRKDEQLYTADSIRTFDEIVGHYSMTNLEWDSPVDISGNGLVSSDILLQMKTYGLFGPLTVHYGEEAETRSVFDANIAMMPTDPSAFARVKLYIPYFMHDMTDGTIGPSSYALHTGVCPVLMSVYEFSYVVDRKWDITVMYTNRYGGENDNTFIYDNISLVLDLGYISFECDTHLYDFNRGEYIKGRLSATYVKL